MAINKKLIKFATQARFDIFLANGDIDTSSVVFIEDTGRLWTQGRYYDPSWGNILNKPTKLSDFTDNLGISTHMADNVKHITAAERTKWNAASGVGDFRDYGLGPGNMDKGTWVLDSPYSGFVSASDHGSSTISSGRAWGFKTFYNSSYGVALAMRNGKAFFNTKEGTTISGWQEIWHKGNLANGTTSQYIRGDGSLATYSDTTYSLMTAAEAITGTATTARTISAKVLADEITRRGNTLYLPLTGGTLSGEISIVKNGEAGVNTRFLTLRDTDYSTNQGRVDIAMLATNVNTGTNRGAVISMRRTNNLGTLHFEVSDNNLLSLIGHSQNVGIGTTSPAYKLDVAGTGRFTDTVTAPRFNSGGTTSQYIRGDGTLATYTDTTYTTGTLAQLNAGNDTTGRLHTAKLLNDWLNGKGYATVDKVNEVGVYNYTTSVSGTVHTVLLMPNGSPVTLTAPSTQYVYDINLQVTSTGTITGARQVVYYDGTWKVFDVGVVPKSSNYPYIEIIDGLPKVRTNHTNNYTVALEIRRHFAPNSNINFMKYMGLDYVAEHTHNAADINAGVLATARIPNLDSSKITTGTLALARIPTGTTSSTVALGNHTHTDYVAKSGDTMSGILTNTGASTVPALHKTSTSGNAMMRVGAASYDKGLGVSLSGDLVFGNWSTVSNLSTSWDKVYHSGNFATGTTSQYIRGDGSLATYTDTTYSLMSLTELNTGTITTNRVVNSKNLNDWLSGKGYINNYNGAMPVTAYSQSNGTLVKTDILATQSAMCTVNIIGNGYSRGNINTQLNFYSYNNSSIINISGVNLGIDIGNIDVFIYDGVVCLWWKQLSSAQSFSVTVWYTNSAEGARKQNRIVSITNTIKPTDTSRDVVITPKNYSLDNHTHTFASLTSKPTTLSGYGITDAYTKAQVDTSLNEKVSKSGDTMTGDLIISGGATSLTLERTSSYNSNMLFKGSVGEVYVGKGNGNNFAVGNNPDLGATANQWLYVDANGVKATTFIGALSGNASSATNLSRSIIAGNGLSGGGVLNANRTITLGTPSDITATSTNSVTATSHTHAIDGSNLDVRSSNYLRVDNIFDVNNASVDTLKFKVYDSYNVAGTPYTYGNILEVNGISGHWKPQLWFDGGAGGKIRYRNKNYNATSFGDWKTLAFTTDTVDTADNLNRSIVAGNGLSGGGIMTADRTITLGRPSNITTDTTNSVTETSHTHNLALGGTASQYLNGTTRLVTIPTISAGSGLTGGGQLTASQTLTLGTPGTLTATSTNSVTSTSHTHSIDSTNFSVLDANRLNVPDTRSVNDAPSDIPNKSITAFFKTNSVVQTPPVSTGSSYAHILNMNGYNSGNSGGGGHTTQLAFGDSLAIRRSTSTSAWGAWTRLALVTDNVASATKLQTARAIKIGNTSKNFDGTANVSWTLAEMGVAASTHSHDWDSITNKPSLFEVITTPSGNLNYMPTSSGITMVDLSTQNIPQGAMGSFGNVLYAYSRKAELGIERLSQLYLDGVSSGEARLFYRGAIGNIASTHVWGEWQSVAFLSDIDSKHQYVTSLPSYPQEGVFYYVKQ